MTAARDSRHRFRLLGVGLALAALLAAATPTGASALWSAQATASLEVPGASFGASSSTPTTIGSSYDGEGPYTGTIELLFPVGATDGSVPWTAARIEVTGTGAVGTTGATLSVGGYGVTPADDCAAVTYEGGGSSATLAGLVGVANAEARGVCVRLDIDGLSLASNHATARIEMVLTVAVGPASVDGTGWSATAPARTIDVTLPSVPTGLPVLACTGSSGTYVTAAIDPGREGPVGVYLDSPEGELLDYYHGTSLLAEKLLWADDMSYYATGRYTIFLVGEDGTGWGTVDVWYDSDENSLACAGDL